MQQQLAFTLHGYLELGEEIVSCLINDAALLR